MERSTTVTKTQDCHRVCLEKGQRAFLQEVIQDGIGEYSATWSSDDPKHHFPYLVLSPAGRMGIFLPVNKSTQKSLDLAQAYTASKWEDLSLDPELIFPKLFSLWNTYALGLHKLPAQQRQNPEALSFFTWRLLHSSPHRSPQKGVHLALGTRVDCCYSQGHMDKLTAKASLASCTICFQFKWPQQSPPSGQSPHCSEALPTCKMGNLCVLSQTQTWNKRCTGLAQQWLPPGIHNLHKSLHLLSK